MGSAIDITPMVPEGTRIIVGYGGGQFQVASDIHQGSIIILPDRVIECQLAFDDAYDESMISPLIEATSEFDLLIIGCGETFFAPPKPLRPFLKEHQIVLEWMDTGAACRTFNVLLAEGRRVAAALVVTE